MKHNKIIGVTNIITLFESVLHKLVELIEIHISKKLRSEIADWQPFWLTQVSAYF